VQNVRKKLNWKLNDSLNFDEKELYGEEVIGKWFNNHYINVIILYDLTGNLKSIELFDLNNNKIQNKKEDLT
jgi:hypothetical protein